MKHRPAVASRIKIKNPEYTSGGAELLLRDYPCTTAAEWTAYRLKPQL